MASPTSRISLPAALDSLHPAREFALAAAAQAGLPDPSWNHVELAVEEIFVNIVLHAYPRHAAGLVEIACSSPLPGTLTVEISDQGPEYNPLTAGAPDLLLPLEERRVGGLGVFLVRQFTDSLRYRRDGLWNRLTFDISAAGSR